MANDLNRCEFIGRLGKDPDTKFAPDGSAICNFSLAVGWKTSGKEGVEWVRIVAFGKLAQICSDYLAKGKQVYVSGRMTTRKWADKDTGQDRYSTEVVADQMQMLGGKNDESEQSSASKPSARQSAPSTSDDDSEIPF